jgi:hypothetical protein
MSPMLTRRLPSCRTFSDRNIRCHPERSRFSGGAKDLPPSASSYLRSLRPLVKARAFGITPRMDENEPPQD